MILKDFAEQRNESPHTIATYIRRHPEEFEGHTTMKGNKLVLDEKAIELLEKVYPLPKPVEVIVDHESREKLIKALEEIRVLEKEIKKNYQIVAQAEATLVLLEDKKQELETSRADLEAERVRANELFRENAELRAKLSAEQSRKWKFPWSK